MYPTESDNLTAESVQGASLALEGVDHIHGGHGLPLGVLGVGDGIPDDILKEDLENSTGLLVDEARDTLHTSTASQTANSWLGDALDVVSQHLPVTLSASLSQSLSSFATSGHVAVLSVTDDHSPTSPAYIPSAGQSEPRVQVTSPDQSHHAPPSARSPRPRTEHYWTKNWRELEKKREKGWGS